MKYANFLIIFLFGFYFCSNNQTNKTQGQINTDLQEKSDTLTINSTGQTISENFVEFFEHFMWDSAFQKSRINFPISFNSEKVVSENDFNYLPFYTNSTHIPILIQDTVIDYRHKDYGEGINLSIINYKESKFNNYKFSKIDKKWTLIAITSDNLVKHSDSEFINFLMNFAKDSCFQIGRISFPLTYFYADYNNDYETIYGSIKKADWKYIDLTETIDNLFIIENSDNNQKFKIFLMRGIENGIYANFQFQNINGEWILIKWEDYST
jgi:hypothetical protein